MAEIIKFPSAKARKSPRAEFAEMIRNNKDLVYVKTIAEAISKQDLWSIKKESQK